jgi:hypothetical protein
MVWCRKIIAIGASPALAAKDAESSSPSLIPVSQAERDGTAAGSTEKQFLILQQGQEALKTLAVRRCSVEADDNKISACYIFFAGFKDFFPARVFSLVEGKGKIISVICFVLSLVWHTSPVMLVIAAGLAGFFCFQPPKPQKRQESD